MVTSQYTRTENTRVVAKLFSTLTYWKQLKSGIDFSSCGPNITLSLLLR